MKSSEIASAVLAGHRILVGEYRLSKCENITWRDAETQARKSAIVIRHTLEVCDGTVAVSEYPPDTLKDPSEYKAPFLKGQKVVCQFTTFLTVKGNMEARGVLAAVSKD